MYLRGKLLELLREPPPAPVELKPYTLPHLIAWLEKKPAEHFYNWESCHSCLFAKYAMEHGHTSTLSSGLSPYNFAQIKFIGQYGQAGANTLLSVVGCGNGHPFWTFGQALNRAREFRGVTA